MQGLFWVGVIILVIIFMPMLVIWALNTLFLLGIPTNGATWFATLILCMAARGK